MKKILIIVISTVSIIGFFLLTVLSTKAAQEFVAVVGAKNVLKKHVEKAYPDTSTADYLTENEMTNEDEKLDIPVYDEKDILCSNPACLLGTEMSYYDMQNMQQHSTGYLKNHFPSGAIRVMPTGQKYIVYDLDSGNRLFLFLRSDDASVAGYPIVINKVLNKADFDSIKVGSSYDDVRQIDAALSSYDVYYEKIGRNTIENRIKNGKNPVTVHYLEEGLLLLTYGEMDSDGNLVITEIQFCDDYCVDKCWGDRICQKINGLDLP